MILRMSRPRFLMCTLVLVAVPVVSLADDELLSTEPRSVGEADRAVRQLSQTIGQQEEVSESVRVELREAIGRLFDMRIEIQQKRLRQIEQRVKQMRKQIREQSENRERLIDERTEAILREPGIALEESDSDLGQIEPFDVIHIGDVVGVYIPGVLPFNPPNEPPIAPPVNYPSQSGGLPPTTGYPITVQSDGTIALPLIEPVFIDGLTVREASAKIRSTYVDQNILREEKARPILTLVKKAKERR